MDKCWDRFQLDLAGSGGVWCQCHGWPDAPLWGCGCCGWYCRWQHFTHSSYCLHLVWRYFLLNFSNLYLKVWIWTMHSRQVWTQVERDVLLCRCGESCTSCQGFVGDPDAGKYVTRPCPAKVRALDASSVKSEACLLCVTLHCGLCYVVAHWWGQVHRSGLLKRASLPSVVTSSSQVRRQGIRNSVSLWVTDFPIVWETTCLPEDLTNFGHKGVLMYVYLEKHELCLGYVQITLLWKCKGGEIGGVYSNLADWQNDINRELSTL